MTFKRLPVALSGLAAMASLTAVAADTAGPQLMVDAKVSLDSVADQHRGDAKWSHGAFLVQSVSPGGLPPTLYTLDREGRLLSSITVAVPGSAYVSVFGWDRRDDNSIVFIGETYSAYGQHVPVIGLISSDGKTERVIRTGSYRPSMLGIAPDGTFWTLGYGMANYNASGQELDPEADVLRHFDRTGKLLGSALPASHFGKNENAVRRLESGYIAVTRSRIAWYGPRRGEGGQYVEIDLSSMATHRYPGLPDLAPHSLVAGFSLTESGNAFLSVYASGRATIFMFDRAPQEWLPLEGPAAIDSPLLRLVGVDGERLVFLDWNSAAIFFKLPH